jgi:hypothetical protein
MTALAHPDERALWRTATAIFTASLIGAAFGCRGSESAMVPAEAPREQRSVPVSAREPSSSHSRSYIAELAPLNAHLSRRAVTGYATFVVNISDGTIRAGLFAEGLSADYPHPQWVQGARHPQRSACPGSDVDDNGDRVIDYVELVRSAGPPLFPLNQEDLSAQAGPQSFPLPSASGIVDYVETAALGGFRNILAEAGQGEVPLGQTTVVLYGIAPGAKLPGTVSSLSGLSPTVSVPVACGPVVEVL